MYPILISAFNFILGWLVRSVLVKFVFFFGLYFIVTEFLEVIITWLPSGSNLPQLFSALPDSVWYFLNFFGFANGMTMVISAYLTRFLIRRVPVIG